MSDKIVVPENIKQAALDAVGGDAVGWPPSSTPWQEIALASVEAALRWLSENPIVPTPEQMAQLKMSSFDWTENEAPAMEEFIAEWQRRMFLASGPVFDATLGGALLGRTFTREQANAMKRIIDTAVHG